VADDHHPRPPVERTEPGVILAEAIGFYDGPSWIRRGNVVRRVENNAGMGREHVDYEYETPVRMD
jgi:hypothetical protein